MQPAIKENDREHILSKRAFALVLLLFGILGFLRHQGLVEDQIFRDAYHINEFNDIAKGEYLPLVGRHASYTKFRTGAFFEYFMAFPFLIQLGFQGLKGWLSLQYVLAILITMILFRKMGKDYLALIVGLVMIEGTPLIQSTDTFQNDAVISPFITLLFALALWISINKKASWMAMGGLGIVVGLLPQVHVGTVFLFPGAALFLAFHKPTIRARDWGLFFLIIFLCWSPYLYYQIANGWPELRALPLSVVKEIDDQELSSTLPRIMALSRFVANPHGAWMVFILFNWGIVRILGKVSLSKENRYILILAFIQILLPLMIYDFPRKKFLNFFVPTFSILVALTPFLARDVIMATGLKMGKKSVFYLCAAFLMGLVLFQFGLTMRPSKSPVLRSNSLSFMMYISRRACELGLPGSGSGGWHGKIHGPLKITRDDNWDYVRRWYAPECLEKGMNHLLIIPPEDAPGTPLPGEVLSHNNLLAIGYTPLIQVDSDQTTENKTVGTLSPNTRYLYVSRMVEECSQEVIDNLQPEILVNDKVLEVSESCRPIRGKDIYLQRYNIPENDNHRRFTITFPTFHDNWCIYPTAFYGLPFILHCRPD